MTMENAERIRKFRKQAGLSKVELAQRLGVLRDDVDMWEENEKEPTIEQWNALATALNVTVDALHSDGTERSYFRDKQRREAEQNAGKQLINQANYPIFIAVLYLGLGFFMKLWHPGWLVFLTIPIYYMRDSYRTPLQLLTSPVAVVLEYLILGFFFGLWHPGWLIFFAIPIFNTFLK